MDKKFWILAIALIFFFSCRKQVRIEAPPVTAPEVSGEFIKQYRAVGRPPVSASFNIFSLMGSFKGELYLEPGEKTLSLVYGYMPLGKSLFEFKLEGRNFLYLDLGNSYAYSNQKDWLKDYVNDTGLDEQDQMALMLIQALSALAGDLQGPVGSIHLGEKEVTAVAAPGPDYTIKYYFNSDPLRLAKMEINKQGSAMSLNFEYSGGQWFPATIKLDGPKISALVKTEKITCPENHRPKINFEIPAGFVNILLSGR